MHGLNALTISEQNAHIFKRRLNNAFIYEIVLLEKRWKSANKTSLVKTIENH